MAFICNVLCFVIHLIFCVAYDDSNLQETIKKIENYGIYFTLNGTLQTYKHYCHLPAIKVLLKELSERYPDIGLVDNPQKSHPFIAVEGVHRKTRNIVAQFLARKMGADMVYNPPQFMIHLGGNFTDLALRKAFFGIAGYAASCTARQLTMTVPAVVAGHWMAQVAFAIAKVFDKVPPPESKIYTWPEDLYMPDIVFFINTQRKIRSKQQQPKQEESEFLPKFIQVFRNWRTPPVFEINSTYLYEEIAHRMLNRINIEFQGNY